MRKKRIKDLDIAAKVWLHGMDSHWMARDHDRQDSMAQWDRGEL